MGLTMSMYGKKGSESQNEEVRGLEYHRYYVAVVVLGENSSWKHPWRGHFDKAHTVSKMNFLEELESVSMITETGIIDITQLIVDPIGQSLVQWTPYGTSILVIEAIHLPRDRELLIRNNFPVYKGYQSFIEHLQMAGFEHIKTIGGYAEYQRDGFINKVCDTLWAGSPIEEINEELLCVEDELDMVRAEINQIRQGDEEDIDFERMKTLRVTLVELLEDLEYLRVQIYELCEQQQACHFERNEIKEDCSSGTLDYYYGDESKEFINDDQQITKNSTNPISNASTTIFQPHRHLRTNSERLNDTSIDPDDYETLNNETSMYIS